MFGLLLITMLMYAHHNDEVVIFQKQLQTAAHANELMAVRLQLAVALAASPQPQPRLDMMMEPTPRDGPIVVAFAEKPTAPTSTQSQVGQADTRKLAWSRRCLPERIEGV